MKTYPATELKPYAEPVVPKDMKEGRVYFALHFLDPDLLVPVLEPFIFLGWNLDGSDPDLRFFQGYESFASGVRYATREAGDSHYFHVYGPDDGKHLFEYQHALEGLMRCALKRRDMVDADEHIRRAAEGHTS